MSVRNMNRIRERLKHFMYLSGWGCSYVLFWILIGGYFHFCKTDCNEFSFFLSGLPGSIENKEDDRWIHRSSRQFRIGCFDLIGLVIGEI